MWQTLKPFSCFFSSVFTSSIGLARSEDDFKKLVSSATRLVKKDVANRLYKGETAVALEHFHEILSVGKTRFILHI